MSVVTGVKPSTTMAWKTRTLRPQPDTKLRNSPTEPKFPASHGRACAPQEEPITPLSVRSVKKEVKEVAKEVADMVTDAATPALEAVKKRVGLGRCSMQSLAADCCPVHPSGAAEVDLRITEHLSMLLTPAGPCTALCTSQPACMAGEPELASH